LSENVIKFPVSAGNFENLPRIFCGILIMLSLSEESEDTDGKSRNIFWNSGEPNCYPSKDEGSKQLSTFEMLARGAFCLHRVSDPAKGMPHSFNELVISIKFIF
jgi:hypothetical protein